MTAPDPAWVEAGARVFREDMPRVGPRAPWEGAIGAYEGWTAEETAAAVIAAVAPLIRREALADLRAKVEGLPTWDGYYEPVVTLREVLALIDGAQ